MTIDVDPINDEPTAVNDTATTNENTPVGGNVLDGSNGGLDTDPDGDTLTVTNTGTFTTSKGATYTLNSDGTFTYDPSTSSQLNGLKVGEDTTDSFTYNISDGNGGTDSATVTITVNGVNDPPNAVNDSATTDEDTLVNGNVLDGSNGGLDTDPDGDSLTVTNTGTLLTSKRATVNLFSDGTFTYDPSTSSSLNQLPGGSSDTDSFSYNISDGKGGTDSATVNITVNGVNDPPVANDDSDTVNEGATKTIDLAGNDNDVDDGLNLASIVITQNPSNGSIVSINPDGTITYQHNGSETSSDQIKYTIKDNSGAVSNEATLTIFISPVNDDPDAKDNTYTTQEDTNVGGNIITDNTGVGADTDPEGDTLSISAVNGSPANVGVAISLLNGTLTVTPTGSFLYVPDQDANGTETFTYTISDGNGGSDSATVTLIITPVNDDPIAVNDTGSTSEDVPVSGNVLDGSNGGLDTDPDGDSLTVTSAGTFTTSSGATVDLDAAGNFTYDPTTSSSLNGLQVGESTTDSFSYDISDGNGGTDSATVTITVTGVNDPPDAVANTYSTNEDSTTSGNVIIDDTGSGVDSDPDGDPLAIDSPGTLTSTLGASVTLNSDGSFTYDPTGSATLNALKAGASIADTFEYTINDGHGATDTATVTVNVAGRNDPPTAVDNTYTELEDTDINGNLLTDDTGEGVDSDPDGDALMITTTGVITTAEAGSVILASDGSITYTPALNFNGVDTFDYSISDGNGGTDSATVTLNIGAENDPPVATNNAYTTNEDSSVGGNVITDNTGDGVDSDPDGDSLTVSNAGTFATSKGATVTLNSDGTFTYDPTTSSALNSLPVGSSDTDTFNYSISDGNGGADTATVTITVNGVNDPPTAVDDTAATNEDTSVNGNVLDGSNGGTDTDPDGDSLTVTGFDATSAKGGSVSINTDGDFTYDPSGSSTLNGLKVGETTTDTFNYSISDGKGGTDTATVTFTITGVNDVPDAVDDTASTDEDSPVSGNVLDGSNGGLDTDPDGDTLSVTTTGTFATSRGGSVTIFANGDFTYDPTGSATLNALPVGDSDTDSFTYSISDGNGGTDTATVTISVSGVNDPPAATDNDFTTNEDTLFNTGNVLTDNTGDGVDSDPDRDSLTVTSTGVLVTSEGATVTMNSDGTFSYDPTTSATLNALPVGSSTTDSFSYDISDGNGGTDTATVTMTVNGVNDPPTATDNAYTTDEDTLFNSGNAITDDTGNGADSDPDGDTLTVSSTGTFVTSKGATVKVNLDGSFSYDPTTSSTLNALPVGSFTTDTFDYTITDGKGGGDTATVTMTINGVNDPPDAVDDTASTDEDSPATGNILDGSNGGLDTDPDGDSLTVTTFDPTSAKGASVSVNASGDFTYDPSGSSTLNGLKVGETTTDTFTYSISDGKGGADTATVTVTVTGVNDPPDAVNDTATTDEETPVSGNVLDGTNGGIDTDPDGDSLAVISTGTFPTTLGGSVTVLANGNFTYDPSGSSTLNALPVGSSDIDTFTYSISDGNGGADTATVSITVNGVNDPPAAVQNLYVTTEDIPVSGNAITDDTGIGVDSDPDGDTLSIFTYDSTSVQGGSVSMSSNGSFTYTPALDFNGQDSFTYTISDGNGGFDTTTVTIDVGPENDPPVAINNNYSTNEDTSTGGNVITDNTGEGVDSDSDFDPLTIVNTGTFTTAKGATYTLNLNGTFTYNPTTSSSLNRLQNGESDTDTFNYTISDGNTGIDTATVTIMVKGVNDPPDAVNDTASTDEDTAVGGNVLDGTNGGLDTDPESDPLTVTVFDATSAKGASVNVNADGDFSYDPSGSSTLNGLKVGETTTDSFTYTISDGQGGTDTATVTVTITGVNDPPEAVNDTASTDEDTPVGGNVLDGTNGGLDTDPDGDSLIVTSTGTFATAEGGSVTISANGNFTYNPTGSSSLNSLPVGSSGTDSFSYSISDGNGGADTATVTITVTGVNDPPNATNNDYTTDEDSIFNTANVISDDTGDGVDSDPDGASFSVSSFDATSSLGASVSIAANGSLTYDPTGSATLAGLQVGETLDDTFTYTISDGKGGTDTATVTITVTGANDPPDAVNDSASTNEDTPVSGNVLDGSNGGLDTDPDGDSLTVTTTGTFATSEGGSVTVTANGVFTYDPTGSTSLNSLQLGELGTDTFSYTISDGNGETDTATVTITVSGVNDPPDAVNDSETTDEDTPVSGNVLDGSSGGLDTDPESDPLTVTTTGSFATAKGGSVTISSNGNFTYDPSGSSTLNSLQGAESDIDTFSYSISDGNGGADTATVTITVNGVNDPPDAVNNSYTTDENTSVNGNAITDNTGEGLDSDPDGDTLNVTNIGTFATAKGASYTLFSDGTFSYDPTTSATLNALPVGISDSDSFNYTIGDGHGGSDTATVTITVNGVNDPPDAVNNSYTTDEDTATGGNVITDDTGDGLDSDPDTGDTLTVTNTGSFTTAKGASYTLSSDGTFTYDPTTSSTLNALPVGTSVTDTFSYQITDGNGGFDTAVVTITVDGVNDAPTATNNQYVTPEDTQATGNVVTDDTGDGVDSDPDGDSLTVTAFDATSAQGGTVNVNSDGTFTYDPPLNFNGSDSFTYTISDGKGGSDTATVTINVGAENDRPIAVDNNYTTDEDNSIGGNVITDNTGEGVDSDIDGDSLTVTNTGTFFTSKGAEVTLNSDGTFSYDPTTSSTLNALPVGTSTDDTFDYTISDGNGGTDTATVTITVSGVNDPPDAVDDTAATDEDTSVGGNVLDGSNGGLDTDPDNDTLTVTGFDTTSAAGATVNVNANGDFSYDPSTSTSLNGLKVGETTSDTFTYTIGDGKGGTDSATVTITITGVNDPPNATDNDYATDEETLFNTGNVITDNTGDGVDSDPDGDSLSVSSFDATSTLGASVSILPDGSLTYDPSASATLNALKVGETIDDTFAYTISDGNGGTDNATVTITVTGVNDPPDAVDNSYTTDEDTVFNTGNVITDNTGEGLDADPDGDTLSVTNTGMFITAKGATVTLNSNGTFKYDPTSSSTLNALPVGTNDTDTFTYDIGDGNGGTDTATVTMTVEGRNDPPDAVDNSYTTDEDTIFNTGNVITDKTGEGLDSDPDTGDTLTVTNTGTFTTAKGATVTLNSNGTFSYDPTTSSTLNALPVGTNDTDSFTYDITDGNGGTDTATVTMTISGRNDPPDAVDNSYTTNEDTSTGGNVITDNTGEGLDSDPDTGDTLIVTNVGFGTTAKGASYTLSSDGTFSYDPSGSNTLNALPVGSSTTDTFDYMITDSNGGFDTATVTITVTGVNDPPNAVDDSAATNEETPVGGNVLDGSNGGLDTDPDGDSLSVTTFDATSAKGASVSVNANGDFTYDPSGSSTLNGLKAGEITIDTFSYTITDSNGGFDTATVTITVTGVNDPPDAVDDTAATNEDTPVGGNVLDGSNGGLDTDPDNDTLTVIAFDTTSAKGASVNVSANGTFTYDPSGSSTLNALKVGEITTDTFTYTISDGNGGTDTATVTVTITGVNDTPDAVDNSYSIEEDEQATGNLITDNTGEGVDSDPDGDTLTVSAFDAVSTQGGSVNVNPNGTYIYDPALNFNGTDTFTYTITDSNGGFDTATVTIVVVASNDPPVAVDNNYTTDEDTSVGGNVILDNTGEGVDSDVDGDTLTVVNTGSFFTAKGATVTLNLDGTLTYDPTTSTTLNALPVGSSDTDTFTYTITDGNSGTDSATVTITVTGVNDPPDAVDNNYATNEDSSTDGNVITNNTGEGVDSDPDGDSLSVSAFDATSTKGASVSMSADGTFTYDPSGSATLNALKVSETTTDTFTYTITDSNGGFDTATVTITVTGVNDAPDAIDNNFATDEDTVLSGVNVITDDTGEGVDSDPDGDPLSVTSFDATSSKGASVSIAADGSLIYDPSGSATLNALSVGQTTTDTFTYTISDGNGGFDTATVTITVTGVNDTPDAVDNNYSTPEDTQATGNVITDNTGEGVDSDPDGDSLTVSAFDATSAQGGTVNVNPDGTFTYDPALNFHGMDTFTYTISDGNGGTDTATVTINVTAANDPPDAIDNNYATDEDTSTGGNVITDNTGEGVDSDPDGDSLTVSAFDATGTLGGTVSVSSDGTFTYDPTSSSTLNALQVGESLNDTFTYTISDGNGGFDTATVTIAVSGVNDPPGAINNNYSTNEDTSVGGNVINDNTGEGVDSDPDGDSLTVTNTGVSTTAKGATVILNADGTFTYNPTTSATLNMLGVGDSDTDTFTYDISDGNGGTDTATVTIFVSGVNDPPNAIDNSYTTDEDTVVNGNAITDTTGEGVDSDIDGDTLALTNTGTFTTAKGATVTLNSNGTFSYDPSTSSTFNALPVGSSDTDSFTYDISDGNGGTDTATVTITIDGANDPPVAQDDSFNVPQGETLSGQNVLSDNGNGVDSDPDGDSLTVTATPIDDVDNGTLVLNSDGTFTYTPDALFFGTDSFIYQVCDPHGGCDTATVTINVVDNVPPVANDDSATVLEGDSVLIDVPANDTDSDGTIDLTTVTIVTPPSNGSVSVNPTTGVVTYTHDGSETTSDSFTYTIKDNDAETSNVATVTITINPDDVTAGINKEVELQTEYFELDQIDYTVTVTNSATVPAYNVTVSDVLPAEVTFDASTATHGSYDNGTGVWMIGSLPGSTTATLTITVTINSGTLNLTVTNTATITNCETNSGDACTLNPPTDSVSFLVTGFCTGSASWNPGWTPKNTNHEGAGTLVIDFQMDNEGGSFIRNAIMGFTCSGSSCDSITSLTITPVTAPTNVVIQPQNLTLDQAQTILSPFASGADFELHTDDQGPATVMAYVFSFETNAAFTDAQIRAEIIINECKPSDKQFSVLKIN